MKRDNDLFDRARRKLTIRYSGVLIVFLGLFVVLVYLLLYLFIWNDQKSRLNELANAEIRTLRQWSDQDANPERRPPREVEDAFSISADQSFYYLVAEDAEEPQLSGEIQPELRPQALEAISRGQFEGEGSAKAAFRMEQGKEATFLVASRDWAKNGEKLGTLYIGKDVTFQQSLFRLLTWFLAGMALVFFVLALWLSHIMARKAIAPIARAYERQREFVADASHELRTPLSVMLSSIEALQLEESIANDAFSSGVLRGLKEEVQSVTRLAGGLLQLARTDSGEIALERTAFEPKAVAESVVDKLRPLAEAKNVGLKLQAPASLSIEWDKEKLSQLLVLLIDNAVKYTPDGGRVDVRLTEETDKGRRVLLIEVADNGIGIAEDALPRVFDRFYRQDKARTRQTGGHGLGLAIAKSLAEAGGGTIGAASKPGEGSTFRIHLPI